MKTNFLCNGFKNISNITHLCAIITMGTFVANEYPMGWICTCNERQLVIEGWGNPSEILR